MGEKRLREELANLQEDPPTGCFVSLKDDDLFKWEVSITGPPSSPYEGGVFILSVQFPQNYPLNPPEYKFITKIYHMNINEEGHIKLYLEEWDPVITVDKILSKIYELLVQPNAAYPLIPEYALLYQTDPIRYMRHCKEYVQQYATRSSAA